MVHAWTTITDDGVCFKSSLNYERACITNSNNEEQRIKIPRYMLFNKCLEHIDMSRTPTADSICEEMDTHGHGHMSYANSRKVYTGKCETRGMYLHLNKWTVQGSQQLKAWTIHLRDQYRHVDTN
jgi:hypothetical protein